MASSNEFLTLVPSGIAELRSAVSAFTGNPNEIIATNGSGVIDTQFLDGVVFTTTNQTINGEKTFVDNIFIDDSVPLDALEIGYFDNLAPADPNTYGIRRTGTSGYFAFMPNSTVPQFVLGSPTGTNTSFIDTTNNGTLNFNVLDTGVDDPGPINFGIGGVTILGSSLITNVAPLSVNVGNPGSLAFQIQNNGSANFQGNTIEGIANVNNGTLLPINILATQSNATFTANNGGSTSAALQLTGAAGTAILLATDGVNTSGFVATPTFLSIIFTGTGEFQINGTPGLTGQVFTSNGAGINPTWDYPTSFGTFPSSRNAAISGDQALRRQNGTFIDQNPYTIPYDATIYAVTVENNPADTVPTWDFQVEVNAVLVTSLTKPNGARSDENAGLSIDVNQGDEVILYFRNASTTINDPGGVVYFRERR